MEIPVFLSYPKPHMKAQEAFIEQVCSELRARNLEPRTLGVTDYDLVAPLEGIRKIMLQSNGIMTIAFKRTLITKGMYKAQTDMKTSQNSIKKQWLTSPFCHIEPAMAFQLGLPVLILRENGVIEDGIMEKGVLGTYMPVFDSAGFSTYFQSEEWRQLLAIWLDQVEAFYQKKRTGK